MNSQTQQAPAESTSAPGQPTADDFQSFFDAGAFAPTDEAGKNLSPEQQQTLEREAQGQQEPPAQEQQPEAPAPEPEGKEYDSLDSYLTEQKLDRDAFLELPVNVKIDGKDQQISLKEAIDGYNLRSVSQARMQQAQEERSAFQAEQTQVRQALGVRIQQIEALAKAAQDQLLGDYNRITPQQWAELRANQPAEYAAAMTDFQSRQNAVQQLLQQAAQARGQETEQATQAELQAIAPEREKVLQARPEWRDPVKFSAAKQKITAAARKLGATDAELQNLNRSWHLLALDAAAQWFQLQASKPGVTARVRATPPMAAPGARQARDPKRDSYTQAREAFTRDPNNREAAERVFAMLAE